MRVFSLVVILLIPFAAHAEPTTLGVFDVTSSDPTLRQTSVDSIAASIGALDGFKVVSRTELEAMVGADKLKQSLGCDDVSCLAEIGSAAGVSRIVSGSVARIDNAFVVNLQLINVAYANVENRSTLSWDGSTSELAELLAAAAELLVLPRTAKKPGRLRLAGTPEDALVILDGEARGPLNVIKDLGIGVHHVRIDAKGFEPFSSAFIIRNGATADVNVHLQAVKDKPLYAKWWFWTIIGAVAAGGAATGIILATEHGTNGTGSVDLSATTPGAAR